MYTIRARNVNDAFAAGVQLIREIGVRELTRAGEALVAPCPVVTVYSRPEERVLFDESRDANPFFHLFESLWMLEGRKDGTWLDRFVRDFSARFAEEDGNIHGAYGYRWRYHFGEDQLDEIVRLLAANPWDRQAVLQMWDATVDLGVPGLKDRPCNTQVYFRVRKAEDESPEPTGPRQTHRLVLDMTVTCRSNDIVWGAYGANAVHFSVLQEYLAARLGVAMGTYYQVSNNWHAYTGPLSKIAGVSAGMRHDPYISNDVCHVDMFTRPGQIDNDLGRFFSSEDPTGQIYANPWFHHTAIPMWHAHSLCRSGHYDQAVLRTDDIKSPDWRRAARQWINRRREKSNG